jgi:hypothetical protein
MQATTARKQELSENWQKLAKSDKTNVLMDISDDNHSFVSTGHQKLSVL